MSEKPSKDLDSRLAKIEETLEIQEKQAESQTAAALTSGINAGQAGQVVGNRSNSMESRCLQAFGVSNPEKLLTLNVGRPAFAGVDIGYKEMVRSYKEAVDVSRFIAQIFYRDNLDIEARRGSKDQQEQNAQVKNILNSHFAKDHLIPMLKAFGTTVAGGGLEWIPTAVAVQYVEEYELEKKVANFFREMPMPTNPFKLPVQTGVTVARLATEGVAMTGSNFNTTNITFDSRKLGEFYPLSEELNEDSAPAILALGRMEVAEAQIRARETVILNGDDTGTHMDNDVTAADDARKLRKGLRKLALANSANGSVVTFSSAVTTAKLDEMRAAMGKFGVNVRDLAYIFSPTTYNQAVNLPEVTSVEKFGPQATILSGTLAAFRGIPIMTSEFVRENVAATGVNTLAGPNTKGLVYLVNARRFWVGVRRPIVVRVQQDLPDHDRYLLASYSRIDFKGHEQNANEVSTVLGIDVTL